MEKKMKTLLIILAGIGALIVIAIASVMYFTSGMSDTADNFFTAVKSNNYDEAYSLLSEDFKNTTSKSQLKTYLIQNSLNHYKDTSWTKRSVSGGRGTLSGSITTESGGVIPISLGFVKGEDDWKIYSIEKPYSGIREETEAASIPSKQEQIKLTKETIHILALSIRDKDMSKMYSHISNLFKRQITPKEMDNAFSSFFRFGDTFLELDQLTPQFSKDPALNENGVLVLKGFFPTKPLQIHFEQKYVYEGLSWKVLGLDISLKQNS